MLDSCLTVLALASIADRLSMRVSLGFVAPIVSDGMATGYIAILVCVGIP
jgi:hypothetical protein